MDNAKATKIFDDYREMKAVVGNEEFTLFELFNSFADEIGCDPLDEFCDSVDEVTKEKPEMTDEQEIALAATIHYLMEYYGKDRAIISLNGEVIYES